MGTGQRAPNKGAGEKDKQKGKVVGGALRQGPRGTGKTQKPKERDEEELMNRAKTHAKEMKKNGVTEQSGLLRWGEGGRGRGKQRKKG